MNIAKSLMCNPDYLKDDLAVATFVQFVVTRTSLISEGDCAATVEEIAVPLAPALSFKPCVSEYV